MNKLLDKFNNRMSIIWERCRALACSLPGPLVATYVISLAYMNFLAIKEFPVGHFAMIDCAFLLSWIPFMAANVVIKLYGIRAAVYLSIFGSCCNTLFSALLWFVTKIPSEFGLHRASSYVEEDVAILIGSNILIVIGSASAIIISTLIKGHIMLRMDRFESDSLSVNAVYKESIISSLIGQFIDNSIFYAFASSLLFDWTFKEIIISILIKTIFEVCMETLCLPIGYISIIQWKEDGIGKQYIDFTNKLSKI